MLQVLKRDEPGVLKRIKGIMTFDKYEENAEEESFAIYGRKWKYAVIPSSVHKFNYEEKFNLSDLIGMERAERYDGQAEAVELRTSDEVLVRARLSKYQHEK